MKPHTAIGIICFLSGIGLGGLLVGIPLGLRLLSTQHHYFEHETFFKGQLGNREVRGITYFEYQGIGFLESGRWKVELLRPGNPDPTTIYTSASAFQEALPRQPTISITDSEIRIEDGEQILKVRVMDAPRPEVSIDGGQINIKTDESALEIRTADGDAVPAAPSNP